MGKHKGFTFIEVALFMAVTAALFIAIALGMQNAIFRQRYDDSTQRFFEFMRSVYSKVSNPQSSGDGSSNYAIYGKLVVFGETTDMLGNAVPSDEQPIFTYDVVGRADGTLTISTGKAAQLLASLDANVVRFNRNSAGSITGVVLASPEEFSVPWAARIENPDRTDVKKSILVVRHPRSGTINTLVYDGVIQANQEVKAANEAYSSGGTSTIGNLLKQYLSDGSFNSDYGDINFCVNPYGPGEAGSIQRRNIRILNNARNASSVEMIDMDGSDNKCV